jgi:hypothetical protein
MLFTSNTLLEEAAGSGLWGVDNFFAHAQVRLLLQLYPTHRRGLVALSHPGHLIVLTA